MSDIIPNLENMTDAEKKAALDAIQVSIAKSKEVQKETLDKIGIYNIGFNETDLGDQLTSVVFIVDERVFNKDKYPNFRFKEKNVLNLIV